MIERLFDDIELTVVFGGMIIFVLYGFWFIGYKIYAFFYPEEPDVFLLMDDEKETSSEGEGQTLPEYESGGSFDAPSVGE